MLVIVLPMKNSVKVFVAILMGLPQMILMDLPRNNLLNVTGKYLVYRVYKKTRGNRSQRREAA